MKTNEKKIFILRYAELAAKKAQGNSCGEEMARIATKLKLSPERILRMAQEILLALPKH